MQDRPQQTPQKRLDKILEGAFAGPGRSQRIFRNETGNPNLNLHATGPKSSSRPDDLGTAAAFVTPELHKYTDMQELLLVDPIHEVAEEGWPFRNTTER